jgi:hypothetical protein
MNKLFIAAIILLAPTAVFAQARRLPDRLTPVIRYS